MEVNQISVTVTGGSRVQLVKNLRAFADNLDGAPATKAGKVSVEEADETESTDDFEEETKPTKARGAAKSTKKAASPADEDEAEEAEEDAETEESEDEESFDEEAEAETEESEDDEEKPKKAAKGKIDAKAVNEACKAHARKHGFEATQAILQKKFKTSSVGKLKPEQFAEVIKAVAVKK
jgi:TATA-binding protein-associated factor Taf7